VVLALMGVSFDLCWASDWGTEYPQAQHGCSAYLRKSDALSTTQQSTGLHLVKKQTDLLTL
jgi:hypothetical protein